jgi:hypothetical protein
MGPWVADRESARLAELADGLVDELHRHLDIGPEDEILVSVAVGEALLLAFGHGLTACGVELCAQLVEAGLDVHLLADDEG